MLEHTWRLGFVPSPPVSLLADTDNRRMAFPLGQSTQLFLMREKLFRFFVSGCEGCRADLCGHVRNDFVDGASNEHDRNLAMC